MQAYLDLKESQVGNDLLNISSRSSQVSRKPLLPSPPPDDLFNVIFSVWGTFFREVPVLITGNRCSVHCENLLVSQVLARQLTESFLLMGCCAKENLYT